MLAADLGLAANTVAKAYRELEAAGLLVGRGRLGTFVVERLPERMPEREGRLAEAAAAFVKRADQLGFTVAEARGAVERALGKSLTYSRPSSAAITANPAVMPTNCQIPTRTSVSRCISGIRSAPAM